jgi:mycothiol synthase
MDTAQTLRAATAADAEDILALNLVHDLLTVGEPNTTLEEIETDLGNPTLVSAVLEGTDGELIGYVWVDCPPTYNLTWAAYVVRPAAAERASQTLVDWLVAKAHELGPGRPVHAFCDSQDLTSQRLYEQAGGSVVRRFLRMGIAFDAPPKPPGPVPGLEIRAVTSTEADLRTMHRLIDTSFVDHFSHESEPYEEWHSLIVEGPFSDLGLWWLATVDGVPAAGLIANVPGEYGYVDALGTLREYRGRGVGSALLLTAFGEFYRRGLRRAVLGVDSDSPTGAVGLYESLGMTRERVGLRYEIK